MCPRYRIKPHRYPTESWGACGVAFVSARTGIGPNQDRYELPADGQMAARQESRHPSNDHHQQINHQCNPRIGWCLLPNTPLVKKTRCLLFVGFGRRLRPTEDNLFLLNPILTELYETATGDSRRVGR